MGGTFRPALEARDEDTRTESVPIACDKSAAVASAESAAAACDESEAVGGAESAGTAWDDA